MQENTQDDLSLKKIITPLSNFKAAFLIFVLGFTVFCNGLLNHYVGDDLGQIVENPLVHSITNVPAFFSGSTFYNGNAQNLIGNYYRPFFITYFAAIYSIFGPNYSVFHFFQISLHIGNAVLLFLLFKTYLRKSISLFLALVFLIHPINSEVVLYISDTQEILFFLFGLSYLLILQKYKSTRMFVVANVGFALSLLSKETGVLFFGIALVSFILFKRNKLVNVFLSGAGIVFLYTLLRLHAIGGISRPTNSVIATYPLNTRLLNIPDMFFYYLKTFIYPLKLSSSYQWVNTKIDINHFFIPLFFDLLFLSIIFAGLIILKIKKNKHLPGYIFFAAWFFIGVVIHMQIIPLDATVAEGWFYFPMVGLLGMIGILLQTYYKHFDKRFLVIISVVILGILAVRTFNRTFDWRDQLTISSHDLQVSKDAWGLENELSYAYFQEGKFNEARIHAKRSIDLHPFMTNYMNLGAAYFALGDYAHSKEAFLNALKYGDLYQIHENLAFLALSYGDPAKSIAFIQNVSLPKHPGDGKLWLCLAALEYNFGDKEKAKDEIVQAYRFDQSNRIIGVYNAIMNDQPVRIDLKK